MKFYVTTSYEDSLFSGNFSTYVLEDKDIFNREALSCP